MCRNITILRGLEPPATREEIEAAALQYVRKVSGVRTGKVASSTVFAEAVEDVANATERLLASLPRRSAIPSTEPPLRRIRAAAGSAVPADR
jgi:hypothetical protein